MSCPLVFSPHVRYGNGRIVTGEKRKIRSPELGDFTHALLEPEAPTVAAALARGDCDVAMHQDEMHQARCAVSPSWVMNYRRLI